MYLKFYMCNVIGYYIEELKKSRLNRGHEKEFYEKLRSGFKTH